MTDLTRLMFDDGAARPAVTEFPQMETILFAFKGREYRAVVYRSLEALERLFSAAPQRGDYFYDERYGNQRDTWSLARFKADPTNMGELTLWRHHRLSPGNVHTHVHKSLISANCVFLAISEVL